MKIRRTADSDLSRIPCGGKAKWQWAFPLFVLARHRKADIKNG